MKTYKYLANVWNKDAVTAADADEFDSERDIKSAYGDGYDKWEVRWLVEEIAEHYYDNRDGWEIAETWSRGSVDFLLWDEDDQLVGKFSVTLEFQPCFNAYESDSD